MSDGLKIEIGIHGQSFLSDFAASYYRNNQSSVDLNNPKEKKKWREILKLSEKEMDEAIAKFGSKLRDIRIGLRNSLMESE